MGLKDRLASRKRPSTTFLLRVDDDTAARRDLATAQALGDDDGIADAQAAIAACHEQITITALAPVDMEALLATHPATAEQQAANKSIFNPDTFVPALLAACIDSDIDEGAWAEYTTKGSLSAGETNALFDAAWNINYRVPDSSIPKG